MHEKMVKNASCARIKVLVFCMFRNELNFRMGFDLILCLNKDSLGLTFDEMNKIRPILTFLLTFNTCWYRAYLNT